VNALNMRTLSLGAALVVSTAALAACGSSSSGGSAGAGGGKANPREGVERDAVTFGVINDLTGPVSAYAVPYVAGLKTYFDRVSKAGGVDGRTIKTIVTDDKLEVPPAITAFKKMQRQTPVLAASAFTSGATQTAVFDMVKSSGIAVLPQYTNKPAAVPRNPNFFLLQPSEADQVDQGLA
jgi:ABC-type branched-subunit amino acid transport system substrate-binding protein